MLLYSLSLKFKAETLDHFLYLFPVFVPKTLLITFFAIFKKPKHLQTLVKNANRRYLEINF